ncbi:thymidine phosphorylase [Algicella marina]|uniref:Thymidine phosphorylase n=1 Tax=Algicella marina TaxID=2683284 RepID=A0A6P1SWZ5_9RHOB|nr:thymidine phosphorylase [Algicella marina]QHQ34011.1 thymidine phosphorylase [Algicella marina]
MLPAEIIALKRDGRPLPPEAIAAFVQGLVDDSFSEGQVAALAMAIYLNGMSAEERVSLTTAMRDSGTVLEWDLPGPVIDKHSTGGVGDNVSLILAPALAACGAFVPMISGRGLGHTGGTLDKFDAIPGYRTSPDLDLLRRVTADIGCAIIGQTADVAPADKRLYAIRDVTGTVESVDLITASILSKKLAAGLDALVLDVKLGSGAFMKSLDEARVLAQALVQVANDAGCRTSALLTDMNEPLASAAGNALEVRNAIDLLTGSEIDSRLWDVTIALGGEALAAAGLKANAEEGASAMADALQSGRAAEIFGRMVAALGGPADILSRPQFHLPEAPVIEEIYHGDEGFIEAMDTRAIGIAVIGLGGGRRKASDKVDYRVGFDWISATGRHVDREVPIARVHAASPEAATLARRAFIDAVTVSQTPAEERPLVLERIG